MITPEFRLDLQPEVEQREGESPDDLVYFADVMISDIAKISELAGRACGYGYLTAEEHRQFRLLCFETEWFNKVTYADGR
jgi:hypothetical protein